MIEDPEKIYERGFMNGQFECLKNVTEAIRNTSVFIPETNSYVISGIELAALDERVKSASEMAKQTRDFMDIWTLSLGLEK